LQENYRKGYKNAQIRSNSFGVEAVRNPLEQQQVRQFMLERMEIRSRRVHLDVIGPMVHNTVELVQYYDHMMGTAFYLIASMLKGDTTEESKIIVKEVERELFNTWWDHLKFDLKEGRVGYLPKWLKKKIKVKYIKDTQKISVEVPVKVLRACPHATFKWDKGMTQHLVYLYPKLDWSSYTDA